MSWPIGLQTPAIQCSGENRLLHPSTPPRLASLARSRSGQANPLIMRIAYCTNVRLPSERAHGHQVAAVCDALTELGHDVTIFCPFRKNVVEKDYWAYHHADKRVKVQYLGTFDPIDSWIPKVLQIHVLNWLMRRSLSHELRVMSPECVYTRTPALLPALFTTDTSVILELHTLPNHGQQSFVDYCNQCRLIVCLTTPMKEELVKWGVGADRIIVEGDAVNLDRFTEMPEKKEAREALKIHDLKKFTVGYAGSFKTMGHDKGVTHISEAVEIIRSKGGEIAKIIVGGPKSELEAMREKDSHPGEFIGFFDQGKLKQLYAACDVLIYPAPKSGHPYFTRDTSPLKIFEYMAAGRPIIAADLPPIHDILDESTAYFFKAGDSADLARAIQQVMDHPEEAMKKAEKARTKVENHTWEKRMKRILDAAHG